MVNRSCVFASASTLTAYPKLSDQSDHRAVYIDQRQLHVGLDPQQVHARETSIIAQANAAVHETRERVHIIENQAQQFAMHVQSEAQSVVQESQREAQQAQNEARSVEHRAYGLVEEIRERHRQELGRVQDVAQEAVASSQQSLAQAEEKIKQLLGITDQQSRQLETQRVQQEELSLQLATLQSQAGNYDASFNTPCCNATRPKSCGYQCCRIDGYRK